MPLSKNIGIAVDGYVECEFPDIAVAAKSYDETHAIAKALLRLQMRVETLEQSVKDLESELEEEGLLEGLV